VPAWKITSVRELKQYLFGGSSVAGFTNALPETTKVPTPAYIQPDADAGLIPSGTATATVASPAIKLRCTLREICGLQTMAGFKVAPLLILSKYVNAHIAGVTLCETIPKPLHWITNAVHAA
jgi:hypothetical protein